MNREEKKIREIKFKLNDFTNKQLDLLCGHFNIESIVGIKDEKIEHLIKNCKTNRLYKYLFKRNRNVFAFIVSIICLLAAVGTLYYHWDNLNNYFFPPPYGSIQGSNLIYGPSILEKVSKDVKIAFNGEVFELDEKFSLYSYDKSENFFELFLDDSNKLTIDAKFYATDNKPKGRFTGNRFHANPNDYYRFKFNDTIVEIIETINLDVLVQIKYLKKRNLILVNGYFFDGQNFIISNYDAIYYEEIITSKGVIEIKSNGLQEKQSLKNIRDFEDGRINRVFNYDDDSIFGTTYNFSKPNETSNIKTLFQIDYSVANNLDSTKFFTFANKIEKVSKNIMSLNIDELIKTNITPPNKDLNPRMNPAYPVINCKSYEGYLQGFLYLLEIVKETQDSISLYLIDCETENGVAFPNIFEIGVLDSNEQFSDLDEIKLESVLYQMAAFNASADKNGVYVDVSKSVDSKYLEKKMTHKLAIKDNPQAQYEMGKYYEDPNNYFQDLELSLNWYLKAANNGNLLAAFELVKIYREDFVVNQNFTKSFKWAQLAVQSERPIDIYNFGIHYYMGQGTERDYKKAYNLFNKCADLGYKQCSDMLEKY